MIEVEANVLLSLFTGGPKIIIIRPEGLNDETSFPKLPVEWIETISANAGETFYIGKNVEEASTLEVPPSNVLAIWNPFHNISTKALEQWWARASGASDIPAFVNGGSEQLVDAIAIRSLKETARITQLNQKLLEELAALRHGLAHHVRVPPEIETLVKNLKQAAPQLIFETPSSQSSSQIITGSLTQPLFVGTRGLLGFDLRVEEAGKGSGHLEVRLRVPASKLELARWNIPYSDTAKGWLACRLEKVLARMDSSVELMLTAQGEGVPPELGVTSTGLMPEFAFRNTSDGNASQQMLEMRIWGGYPGLTYDSPGTGITSHANMNIADHLISKAQTTRPLTWAYPYFGYQDGGRLLLRPLRENPASAAKIELPSFPGLSGVSCTAKIDDALCQTKLLVRAALCLSGQNVDDIEKGTAALAVTEWVELTEPLKTFELRLGLSLPTSEPTELHIFSRLPQGGKLDHGKVVFGEFKTILDERLAFTKLPYLPVEVIASS